jgi:predicted DNA-binding protein with PD1-like motif
MRFQQFDGRSIVRLDPGETLMGTLVGFLQSQGIEFASLTAAGAVEWVQLGYFNPATRSYEFREFPEQLEVVSFEGNASRKDGQPWLHLHGVFGRRDFSTIGGHIKDLRVRPTLEIWLRTESVAVRRIHDQPTGLELLDLPTSGSQTRAARTQQS